MSGLIGNLSGRMMCCDVFERRVELGGELVAESCQYIPRARCRNCSMAD